MRSEFRGEVIDGVPIIVTKKGIRHLKNREGELFQEQTAQHVKY